MPSIDDAVSRRTVNLSLNPEFVTRARGLTNNLSATVETLLTGFVEAEEQHARAADRDLQSVLAALEELHERPGLLSEAIGQL